MNSDIILSDPQAEFYYSVEPHVGLVAGFGSGKTDIALLRSFNTMFAFPKANVLYAAPTMSLVNDIWYPKVDDYLTSLGLEYHIHQSKNIIKVAGCGKMFCKSMEHPHKMVGFEVLDAYLDELDILPSKKALEVYRKAKARCRQKIKLTKPQRKFFQQFYKRKPKYKPNQLLVTTTPEGHKTTYELFKRTPLKHSRLIQMSTYSNQHNLPDDYIQGLKDTYPPQLIEAYILGNFVNLTQGVVYPSYNRVKNRSILYCRPNIPLHIGMDFNVGKMSAVIHVVSAGKPHAVKELVEIADTPSMIITLKQMFPNNSITVYPDASGNRRNTTGASVTDLKLLRSADFNVVVNHVNPAVKDRVNSMNAMFCNGSGNRSYYVNDFECKNYSDCLEHQCYDANGNPEKNKGEDHLPDAGGYYITKEFGISKPSIGLVAVHQH